MRNWNNLYLIYQMEIGRSPAYLWGIETIFSSVCLPKSLKVSSLPMRNWNGCEERGGCSCCSVSSLPMRNWNKLVLQYLLSPFFVSSLPMRNWNSYCFLCRPRAIGLQPTYEELKLGWRCICCDGHACLQPTYEELKLIFGVFEKKAQAGLQPTYEELKQFFAG